MPVTFHSSFLKKMNESGIKGLSVITGFRGSISLYCFRYRFSDFTTSEEGVVTTDFRRMVLRGKEGCFRLVDPGVIIK